MENSERDESARPCYLSPEKPVYGSQGKLRIGPGTTDWLKIEKGVRHGFILSHCVTHCINFMQSTTCERLAWMNDKQESRLPGEISTASDMQRAPL